MAKLTSGQRKKLPSSSFAIPSERKYPVTDRSHAANALSRVAANGTPAEKAAVRKKVASKFPDMGKSKSSGKKK
jgi:hypothetical protein